MSSLKDGMAKAAAGFEKTQAKVKEGMEKAMKTAEEFVAFSQGNLEALVKSGQIWAAGHAGPVRSSLPPRRRRRSTRPWPPSRR